jgi:adenylyl cyclase-associated protein
LEGNKWVVENHDNNKSIVIEQPDLKHVVYIYGCTNSTIQIKGKVNAVVVDGCKKTAVVVESVVSSVDLVNCKSVQAQILGKAPTATIEKTDGCLLYLSRECLDIEIFSSKSSEMNVSIPGKTEKDDFIEKAIVEQYKTVVKGDSLVTVPVEHKG